MENSSTFEFNVFHGRPRSADGVVAVYERGSQRERSTEAPAKPYMNLIVGRGRPLEDLLSLAHYRAVAARRLADGYIGPHLMLACALDYWHDVYSDSRDYRGVWCGIIWC